MKKITEKFDHMGKKIFHKHSEYPDSKKIDKKFETF